MNLYATLVDLRRLLGLTAAQTTDDDLLLRLLEAAARLLDGYAGRRFYPLRAARSYTVTDPAELLLGDDLLSLHSLTNGDGSAIDASLIHLQPAGTSVKSSLLLDRTQVVFTHTGDPVDSIALDATWGFHPTWADAWSLAVDHVLYAPLSAEASTLTVIDADAPLATGYGIRFAVGQLLRIEEEYLHILSIDTATNTLTVTRGANGTTAAEHAQNSAIDVYRPPADVQQVCLRAASWLYRQKDAGFVYATGGLRGQVLVPPTLPEDVQQALAPYVRLRVA